MNNDLPDDLEDDFKQEFADLVNDNATTMIETRPIEAWCLLCAVQLAWRHPQAKKSAVMGIAVQFALALQDLIATNPALQRAAQAGWDPAQDVPA